MNSSPTTSASDHSSNAPWALGPFVRDPEPVLGTQADLVFDCPVAGQNVRWAAKDVFNPGAIVRDGRVCLLVRAEDQVGRYAGVSRIGLASSADGKRFVVEPEPVIYPDNDRWQAWEWPGGCEDPRVVESPDGGYVCLYTAFNGMHGSLFVATSPDLRRWTKHGPAFWGTAHACRWAKSGSIVTRLENGRLIAAKIDDRYWMYWGEGTCFAATSRDLIHWEPLEFDGLPTRTLSFVPNTGSGWWDTHHIPGPRALRPLLFPRPGRFDSLLVEPGPPAVLTEAGIILIYNGGNHPENGDKAYPPGAYQPAQALFDAADPASCLERPLRPFLRAMQDADGAGQYQNVCFAQGLVRFQDTWILYHGMADSRIGRAVARDRP